MWVNTKAAPKNIARCIAFREASRAAEASEANSEIDLEIFFSTS
jgi:hypothetical protein